MKRNKLKKYAGKFYQKMGDSRTAIVLNFDREAIHDWRLEYKKLRAFLRLLKEGVGQGEIPLSKRLKKIYSLLGFIRDQQLQEEKFCNTLAESKIVLPPNTGLTAKEIGDVQSKLFELLASDAVIKSNYKTNRSLPYCLKLPVFSAWFQKKCCEVREMMWTLPLTDEKIHAIRKILKDLVYNLEVYRQQDEFPPGTWKEKVTAYFDPLLEELGNYQDICTALAFVESLWLQQLHTDYREPLALLKETLDGEKAGMRQALVTRLRSDIVLETGRLENIPLTLQTDL